MDTLNSNQDEFAFIVIIPARLGSTRLPGKPLADLAGMPMVVRVAKQAALSGAKRVIVACDDIRIKETCEQFGVAAYVTRTDHQSGSDRIAEVADTLNFAMNEVIVNVQGDEPLIDPALIRATAMQIKNGISMATAAHPIRNKEEVFNPNVVKVVINKAGCAMYFSRAVIPWDRDGIAISESCLPPDSVFYRHIGIYAYTRRFLGILATLEVAPMEKKEALEQLRVLWHGYPIGVHITSLIPLAGVDTPEDLLRVQEYYLQHSK